MHNITFSTADSFSINAPYFQMIYDYTEHQLWIYHYMVIYDYQMK